MQAVAATALLGPIKALSGAGHAAFCSSTAITTVRAACRKGIHKPTAGGPHAEPYPHVTKRTKCQQCSNMQTQFVHYACKTPRCTPAGRGHTTKGLLACARMLRSLRTLCTMFLRTKSALRMTCSPSPRVSHEHVTCASNWKSVDWDYGAVGQVCRRASFAAGHAELHAVRRCWARSHCDACAQPAILQLILLYASPPLARGKRQCTLLLPCRT